jgi:hypothetical protein
MARVGKSPHQQSLWGTCSPLVHHLPSFSNGSDGNATIALSDMAKLQTMLALFHIWVIDFIPHCSPGDTFNVPTAHPRQAVSLRGRRDDNKPKKK